MKTNNTYDILSPKKNKNESTTKEKKMIQELQDRFELSQVQAAVIYYTLQNHFEKKKNDQS